MNAAPLILVILYGIACSTFGSEPGAPLWLRWPAPAWNRIAHDWRRPRPRPDYAKITRLERELGIGQDDPTA
ncbi:hypothetical protein [Streptomyces sp. NPDC047968]|uniref:hypothetical protein n=1 Tax=unclassified Streptomyces TaxID=2593676 RepID=UPI0034227AB4